MAHEIDRILRAAGRGPWFIESEKAEEILAMLSLRADQGPRGEAWGQGAQAAAATEHRAGTRLVRVLPLQGAIVPRGNMLSDMSGAASMDRFQKAFSEAANAPDTAAIVLAIDSPGGQIDQVPETVAMIRAARREDRPIVAVANTRAGSAAYWIASAADEIVASPSASVGSIGVYMVHQDMSEAASQAGVKVSYLSAGARKVEGNPFEPLDDAARAHFLEGVRDAYNEFTSSVAKSRGVPVSVVRADPEDGGDHMGGGRSYGAKKALSLGMIDRIETLDAVVARLASGRKATERARLNNRRRALALR